MAATVQIISAHGATVTTTETQIDGTTIKYKRADNDTNDTANPVPKPAAGSNFSWRKSMRIKITVAPDGDITNLRWFGPGASWGTGVTLWAHTKPTANYDQASSADDSAKIGVDGGSAVTDAINYITSAVLTVNAGTVVGATTGYGTQDLVETQIEVASTASRGTKGPQTFTYRFDET